MGLEHMPASRREPESPATAEPAETVRMGSRLRHWAIRCLKALGILLLASASVTRWWRLWAFFVFAGALAATAFFA